MRRNTPKDSLEDTNVVDFRRRRRGLPSPTKITQKSQSRLGQRNIPWKTLGVYFVAPLAAVAVVGSATFMGVKMGEEPLKVDSTTIADELEKSVRGAHDLSLDRGEWSRTRSSDGKGNPVVSMKDVNGRKCFARIHAKTGSGLNGKVMALELRTPGVCLPS